MVYTVSTVSPAPTLIHARLTAYPSDDFRSRLQALDGQRLYLRGPLGQSPQIPRLAYYCFRLGWLTDIHLNFVSLQNRQSFYVGVLNPTLDALLLGGDIGEADSALRFLAEMEHALRVPI